MRKLSFGKKVSFLSLFKDSASKSDMVATFLAVLELIKSKKVVIDGEMQNPSVELTGKEQPSVEE